MKARLFILPVIVSAILTARADEKLAVLNVGSEVYSNVTVTSINATDVFFTYSGGMGNAKLKRLSPAPTGARRPSNSTPPCWLPTSSPPMPSPS